MPKASVIPNAKEIVRLRGLSDLTQEEMAVKAGYAKRTIERLEAGAPTRYGTLESVAGVLKVATEQLILPDNGDRPGGQTPTASPGSAPPPPALVVGRENALRDLKLRLGIAAAEARQGCVQVLTAVRGWPGIGKTTLAAALAHDPDVAAAFPDGVLWTSLGPQPHVLSKLANWGKALGCDQFRQLQSVEEASGLLSALLRGRRLFLVVDDVWEAEHAVPFRVAGRGCAILLTTRSASVADSLAPTPGDVYRLDILSEADALDLLRLLAPTTVERHLPECRELVRALEGLPLALQVAGRLLNVEAARGWDVGDLLSELRADTARILATAAPADLVDRESQTTPTVAALLRKSTDRLDPETRERFAYLGAFAPKPATFSLEDMAAVWRVPAADAKRTADELMGRGLIEPIGEARCWMHGLLVKHADSLCTE